MTADDILKIVAGMPQKELVKIQRGLAALILAELTPSEKESIRQALAESEEEFARGEGLDEAAARGRLGLKQAGGLQDL